MSPTMVRQVVWNLPKGLYDLVEKARALAVAGGAPKELSTENFAMFLVDRAARLYIAENEPKSSIIDPVTGEGYRGEYRGTRTPAR